VSYDTNHHVRISVPLDYRNSTCGLCGNFNNRPEDDFRTRQGAIVSSDVDFANSWRASGDDEPSCDVRCGGLDCSGCTAEQTELYSTTAHCGIIQSSSGPFAACHQQHPPQRFVESCVYDLCVGGGYQPFLCQAIEAYASQCQQNGVQVSWRRPGFCEIPCPANSHFESQGTGCPPTCVNPNFTEDCPLPARESCVCNAGYVLSAGVCVPHAECGCSFEGRYYSSGETVILGEDCGRRCSCSYGSMTCSSHACGPHESCSVEEGERGCRPNSYATCWIRGPGSYQTFDKLTYRYPGACRLTLAKVMGTSSHPHFMVTVRHPIKVKHRSILFYVMNTENIHFNIFSYLQVDSQLIKLPYSSASNRIQIYHSSLHSVTLRTSFGVTVQTVWPHFVQVTAPSVYAGSLGGLCGNYNGHPHDDFRTPNGFLVNSSQTFGDSWRDGSLSAHCVENLDEDTENNHNVSEYCGILTSPQGPFAPCWSTVDPQQQVHVCEQIIQGSEDPASKVCEVLRDYALMCQQNGVVLEEWRNVTGCELACPANSHYELCGDSCPSACPSLSFPFTCNTQCQEGCQCDDGFVLNGNQCVPPTSCGCYHQGRYRHGGEQFKDGEECQSLCTCNGTTGTVHCVPSSCGPQESCRVVEGVFGCHPKPHGLDCPANSHYELCGTDCGHTCASSPDATCEHVCSEGCFCDEGFLRSGTQCVPMESCGCQYDGFYYNAGDSFWTDGCSQRCKCHAPNDLRCSAASCILDQRCTIKNGLLGCFDAMSTCTVWGDPHYVSFDGALSHFQGTCSYIITESVRHRANETQFRVIGTNNHRGNNLVSFVSAVISLTLTFINGSAVSLPTIAGTLAQLERQGNFIVVNAGDLVVQFDGQSTLLVRTAENRKNRLTGMCGNANNDPADDKVFPNGTLAVNDNEFGHSWKASTSQPRITDQLSDLTNVEGYSALCSIITNTSGPFAACHPHSDPRPFFSSCVYDLCLYTTANGMLCSAVAAYERTCAVAGVNVSEWRSGLSCGCSPSPTTPPSTCTARMTVDEIKAFQGGISSASSAGVPVQLGDSFWSDGTCAERCTCTSEGLQCQSQPCSFSQICRPAAFQFSCQTIQRRTCTIVGDPHYYTFDNQVFHFQGTCTYVLSEQCGSALPYYRVEGKNEHRGSTRVSWVRLVKVFVYDEVIELVKGHRGKAKVNGDFVSTPISLNNGTVQVYQSGFFVVINTDFGLEVSYDTNHHVRISVPLNYRNSTCGLCGNFNNRPEDDFRTRQGEIVSSDVDFANSWRASGDDEPSCNVRCGGLDCSGCTAEQTELYSTTAHCGIIQSSSGPFAACHQQHPPQRFVESCVYDLCVGGGYQPFLCQAIEAYATQCQQNGVQVSWRRPGFCEIPCPANSHFESQGTGCPPTCVNPNFTEDCPLPARESCVCNAGYVLSAGVCVPHAECGCSFEGRYYSSGETVILREDCGRRCSCSYGSMTCSSHACGPHESCSVEEGERGCRPNSYATCWIRGPGSYQTFDKLTYRYPGACRLTLAKVMGTSSHPHFMVTAEKVSLHSVTLRTSFGVTVQTVWPHFVQVTAPSVYAGSLGGLCGNYNGHPRDDFHTPNGVLVNISQFSVEAKNEPWNGQLVSVTAEVFVKVWGYEVRMSRNNRGMVEVRGIISKCLISAKLSIFPSADDISPQL
uniref:VWFD domain-containing protein n=1 Tax=Salarias fasciatus TaxID=181472 RepID=A0A672F9V1_SALFA